MRINLLILFIILAPTFTVADTIPSGCYVADYYRTDPCWYSSNGVYLWTQSLDRVGNTAYYGPTVETIIYNGNLDRIALGLSNSDLNQCNADYNALAGRYNTNDAKHVADYNGLVAEFNAQLALVKKLRKKCGKACKKIK